MLFAFVECYSSFFDPQNKQGEQLSHLSTRMVYRDGGFRHFQDMERHIWIITCGGGANVLR